jgi:hypothetical protein
LSDDAREGWLWLFGPCASADFGVFV